MTPVRDIGAHHIQGNHAISVTKALRELFPIKDGSIFDRGAIATGLENLSLAYGETGCINFVSMSTPTFDNAAKVDFLEIYVDEGKQFRVSTIDILDADVRVLNDLGLKPGEVYDARLVNLLLRKHPPGADVNDTRIVCRTLDERNGKVALTFDFRNRCKVNLRQAIH